MKKGESQKYELYKMTQLDDQKTGAGRRSELNTHNLLNQEDETLVESRESEDRSTGGVKTLDSTVDEQDYSEQNRQPTEATQEKIGTSTDDTRRISGQELEEETSGTQEPAVEVKAAKTEAAHHMAHTTRIETESEIDAWLDMLAVGLKHDNRRGETEIISTEDDQQTTQEGKTEDENDQTMQPQERIIIREWVPQDPTQLRLERGNRIVVLWLQPTTKGTRRLVGLGRIRRVAQCSRLFSTVLHVRSAGRSTLTLFGTKREDRTGEKETTNEPMAPQTTEYTPRRQESASDEGEVVNMDDELQTGKDGGGGEVIPHKSEDQESRDEWDLDWEPLQSSEDPPIEKATTKHTNQKDDKNWLNRQTGIYDSEVNTQTKNTTEHTRQTTQNKQATKWVPREGPSGAPQSLYERTNKTLTPKAPPPPPPHNHTMYCCSMAAETMTKSGWDKGHSEGCWRAKRTHKTGI